MDQGQDRAKVSVNVQDSFYYAMRREGKPVHIHLLTGRRVTGVLRRFDRYALIIENHGIEHLVYKHAVATVCLARAESEQLAASD